LIGSYHPSSCEAMKIGETQVSDVRLGRTDDVRERGIFPFPNIAFGVPSSYERFTSVGFEGASARGVGTVRTSRGAPSRRLRESMAMMR
jgi:hypothetical protein